MIKQQRLYSIAILFFLFLSSSSLLEAQENTNQSKFKQLGQELPTPNVYRAASGAPGHQYWQQKADYMMNLELDDEKQRLYGEETITYHNNSPDPLEYLWLQLDQNVRAKDSDSHKIRTGKMPEKVSSTSMKRLREKFDGGFKIDYVKTPDGKALSHTIVKTMMRINLPKVLQPGEKFTFNIKWWYNINNRMEIGGRSGYEYFEEDDNYLYTIAQYFPRMCVYNDVEGWQNKQFLGRGEFALLFGDYDVKINVPADHLVAATGIIANTKDVLTKAQINRYEKAKKERTEPVMIVTPEEALNNESSRSDKTKTWHFKAKNVRDFAFASSRKFIWDAMGVEQSDGSVVMAMSMYPKEGNPLWEKYSTKSVAHTLKWYSHYTFDYPYPVAWSIHSNRIGMEYPMICFNGGRPEKDGTYSKRTKYGMISVIIHEVGHNYFPMIVNSDERQWTWMDEGLNSFVQFLAEQQWERDYPSRGGFAYKIINYMKGDKSKIMPIMTNSESIFQFGNNAYSKPATALNILRESIIGREQFDFAFKTYSKRWMFKHPSPADFFRTMEDASGTDLDWFWRGWFYTTDHVDIAIKDINHFTVDPKDPQIVSDLDRSQSKIEPRNITSIRNEEMIAQTQDEMDKSLRDFYTDEDEYGYDVIDEKEYNTYLNQLSAEEKAMLTKEEHFYEVTFVNEGGLVMPIFLEFQYADGTRELRRIPAEIWKMSLDEITKVFITEKEVKQFVLDPYIETADTNTENNYWPAQKLPSRFEMFKNKRTPHQNPMQRVNSLKKMEKSGTN